MGKLGDGASGAESKNDVATDVGDRDFENAAVAGNVACASPTAASSPIAPSTPSRRFQTFNRLLHWKQKAAISSEDSGSDVDLSGRHLAHSTTTKPTTATTSSPSPAATALLADSPTSSPSSSSSPPTAPPPVPNAKELRDHVAKFTSRSNSMGALIVAETLAGWLLTAAAPTLFDRHFRSSSSSVASLCFYLAWGALRACSYVRAVILMHDLVHGIVFTSRKLNSVLAFVIGLTAWTSSFDFGSNHRRHHARLAVEEELEFDADHTVFWTVKEWRAWRPCFSKGLARVLRDPLVYHFVTAPAYLLLFGSTCPGEQVFFFFFFAF